MRCVYAQKAVILHRQTNTKIMSTGLAILGAAAIALYLYQNKKVKELENRIDQNYIDDVEREKDTQQSLNDLNNPYNAGGIEVFPYVMFSHMSGSWENKWYGKVVWEIRNNSGHPIYLKGIMSNLRLCGYLCLFLPSNSERFPVKLEDGQMIDPGCTWQYASWIQSREARDEIRKSMPSFDTEYPIVECDAVLEVYNPNNGDSDYITLRNLKGVAIWRSANTMWPGVGEDATNDPNWKNYVEKLNG